jgi:hypothetical protein
LCLTTTAFTSNSDDQETKSKKNAHCNVLTDFNQYAALI